MSYLKNKVRLLKRKPQPAQRTKEWYEARNTRITASEAAACLYRTEAVCQPYVEEFGLSAPQFKYEATKCASHYDTKEDYIIKKCASFYGENTFKDSVYTLWGKKYEEIATRLYRKLYSTDVIEFGLLPHSRLCWLGASPDGITPNGVMLEIKCPYSRKIDTNVPPLHYWIQCQIQLEVTGLDMCHFLECEIKEIDSEEEWLATQCNEKQDKGILLQVPTGTLELQYIYPPDNLHKDCDYIDWKNTQVTRYPSPIIPKYYIIMKFNVINIRRRKDWFANVRDDIKKTWKLLMQLQCNYEDFISYKTSIHNIKSKQYLDMFNTTTCMIDDNDSDFAMENNSDISLQCQINSSE